MRVATAIPDACARRSLAALRRGGRLMIAVSCVLAISQAVSGVDITAREKAQKLTARGVEQFKAGQTEQGRNLLEEAIRVDDTVYEAYFWLGRFYAQKAASSTEAKQKAIESFRAAAALQPYGDEGDLIRAWLAKLAGRPKSMVIVPIMKSGETYFSSSNTDSLVKSLGEEAVKAGYEVTTRERTYNSDKEVAPDKIWLKSLALDSKGLPQAGWVVFVGAGNSRSDYNRLTRRYDTSIRAEVWIGDALSYVVCPKATVSSSSFSVIDMLPKLPRSSGDPVSHAQDAVARLAWRKVSSIVSLEVEPTLADEILLPVGIPGVYARSTAPTVANASARPTVVLYASGPEWTSVEASDDNGLAQLALRNELAQEAVRKMCSGIQTYVLTDRRLNVIGPSYTKGLVQDRADDISQVCRDLISRLNADYSLCVRFTKVDAAYKSDPLGLRKEILANCCADLCLMSTGGKILDREPLEVTEVRGRWLQGDVVDVVMSARAVAYNRLSDAVIGVLAKHLPVSQDKAQEPHTPAAGAEESDAQVTAAPAQPLCVPKIEAASATSAPSDGKPGYLLAYQDTDGIQVRGLDGQTKRLLGGDFIDGFSWSPDGKKIAAVVDEHLWLVDQVGGKTALNISGPAFLGHPAWLPDGRSIIVGRDKIGEGVALWLVDHRSQRAVQLSPYYKCCQEAMDPCPIVSPNGRYVAYYRNGMVHYLDVIDLETRKCLPNSLLHKLGFVGGFSWMPDSRSLIVGMSTDRLSGWKGPGGLWKLDVKTQRLSPWAEKGASIGAVNLSPDGKSVLTRGSTHDHKLELLSTSGKNLGTIRASGGFGNVSWSPDSRFFACESESGIVVLGRQGQPTVAYIGGEGWRKPQHPVFSPK